MKIIIDKFKKKIFVRGDTQGMKVKDFLDIFFNTEDFESYRVEHEVEKYSYPPISKEQTTTMLPQSGD